MLMAISKSFLVSFLSEKERKSLDELESKIDTQLKEEYFLGKSVCINFSSDVSKNVRDILIMRYREKGWTVIYKPCPPDKTTTKQSCCFEIE